MQLARLRIARDIGVLQRCRDQLPVGSSPLSRPATTPGPVVGNSPAECHRQQAFAPPEVTGPGLDREGGIHQGVRCLSDRCDWQAARPSARRRWPRHDRRDPVSALTRTPECGCKADRTSTPHARAARGNWRSVGGATLEGRQAQVSRGARCHCPGARQACRLANGLLIRRRGVRRRPGSLTGRCHEPGARVAVVGCSMPLDATGDGSFKSPSDTHKPAGQRLGAALQRCGSLAVCQSARWRRRWGLDTLGAAAVPRPFGRH
jgi:hypothetical protein